MVWCQHEVRSVNMLHVISLVFAFTVNKERNPKKAIPFLERACSANHAPSCYNLAVLYNLGDVGVEKNEKLYNEYKVKTTELFELVGGQNSISAVLSSGEIW